MRGILGAKTRAIKSWGAGNMAAKGDVMRESVGSARFKGRGLVLVAIEYMRGWHVM